MHCPGCGRDLRAGAWICPECSKVLDPSPLGVADETLDEQAPTPTPSLEAIPEAMILGEIGVAASEFEVVEGPGAGLGGETSTFLYYAAGLSNRSMRPNATPRRLVSSWAPPLTPYERAFLDHIDGTKTVRQLRHLIDIPVGELVITLLTLVEKALITFDPPEESPTLQEPSHLGSAVTQAFDDETPTALVELSDLDTTWSEASDGRSSKAQIDADFDEDFGSLMALVEELTADDPTPASGPESSPIMELPLDALLGPAVDPAEAPVSFDETEMDLGLANDEPQPPNRGSPLEQVPPLASFRRPIVSEPETSRSEPDPSARAVSNVRPTSLLSRKAEKLFEQALADCEAGRFISARLNLKLASAFDPENPQYLRMAADLEDRAQASVDPRTTELERARELYESATEAEEEGDFDEAVRRLEAAIRVTPQASFHNRLGVLLATRKKNFLRAQQLVETALELSPNNPVYEKNLAKILGMAAATGPSSDLEKPKGRWSGLLVRLGFAR